MSITSDKLLLEAIDNHIKTLEEVEVIRKKVIAKLSEAIDKTDIEGASGKILEAQMQMVNTLGALLVHQTSGRMDAAKLAANRKEQDANEKSAEMIAQALRQISTNVTKLPSVQLDTTAQLLGSVDKELTDRYATECKPVTDDELREHTSINHPIDGDELKPVPNP